jgi:SpoVK/Ycf46/Vps4 family AAA+-type ATPase
LCKSGEGRLCLYGPSGTGKSEFARYLSAELGKPLISVAGSDLLQPWAGLTEQAIATAFADARTRGAVLLFDEADSWLRSRQMAGPHWQISQVNEFLQQLEHHTGVVVLTTNNLPSMDAAALRRLDVKVEFRYLQPHQAWQFFCQLIKSEHGDEARGLQPSVSALRLTPGDFACVQRRMRIMGTACNAFSVLSALREEYQLRMQLGASDLGVYS